MFSDLKLIAVEVRIVLLELGFYQTTVVVVVFVLLVFFLSFVHQINVVIYGAGEQSDRSKVVVS